MAANDIDLLKVYDKVAGVDAKVEALIGRVSERLDSGQRSLEDHEKRLRTLESQSEQRRGGGRLATVLISAASGGIPSAVITWLLEHH